MSVLCLRTKTRSRIDWKTPFWSRGCTMIHVVLFFDWLSLARADAATPNQETANQSCYIELRSAPSEFESWAVSSKDWDGIRLTGRVYLFVCFICFVFQATLQFKLLADIFLSCLFLRREFFGFLLPSRSSLATNETLSFFVKKLSSREKVIKC